MTEAIAQYVQRLDLGEDPFAPGFVNNYFYAGASRKQLLDQITHLSCFGDHVVILTGSAGSGKSTLLDATFERLQSLMDCCHINGELVSSPQALLGALSEQLRLHLQSPVSKSDFLLALETCTEDTSLAEPILIAVDQAHYLELEGYDCLLDLFNCAKGMIRLLLIGEDQVEQLTQLAGFVNERTKVLDIEPLTVQEIDEYIMGVLGSVGYAGNQPLDSDQLAVLREQSHGNIGEINKLMPSLLNNDTSEPKKPFEFAIPSAHLLAIAILVVALVISYSYQGSDNLGGTETPGKPLATHEQKSIPIELPVAKQQRPQTTGQKASVFGPVPGKPDASNTAVVQRFTKENKPALAGPSPATPAPATPSSLVLVSESQPRASDATKQQTALGAKQFKANEVSLKTTGEIDQQVTSAATPPPVTATKPSAAPVKVTKPSKSPVAKTTPAKTATHVSKSSVSPREKRVLDMPASAYMLQLLGSVEEKRSREFVKRYIEHLPITYVEVKRKGKPWYIVLTGPFDDKTAAVKAIDRLPNKLQTQKPWARSVAGIQKDIQSK